MHILGVRDSNIQMRAGGTPLCTEQAGEEGGEPQIKCRGSMVLTDLQREGLLSV